MLTVISLSNMHINDQTGLELPPILGDMVCYFLALNL